MYVGAVGSLSSEMYVCAVGSLNSEIFVGAVVSRSSEMYVGAVGSLSYEIYLDAVGSVTKIPFCQECSLTLGDLNLFPTPGLILISPTRTFILANLSSTLSELYFFSFQNLTSSSSGILISLSKGSF